jgi:hypothetical protein
MMNSRARNAKKADDRETFRLRRAGSLLGLLALLTQLVAGMIPMPLAGAGPAGSLADLCLSPDSPLAHQGGPANDANGKAGDLAHDCQICLTLQLAGHILPTGAVVLAAQDPLFILAQPAEAKPEPVLASHSPAAARAPPATV